MKAKSRLCSAFHLRHQEARAEIQSSNPSTIVQGSVERTFAWLVRNRRLAKDYERLVETGEMLLYLAMSRLMTKRLAHAAA
ncbi:transposase (plasmid) [Microvirga sp. RSM25]|uniref:transposase n=1 Tax=Microvirga sp. RSM25 TaxID=3273802 RepID=UPI00384CF5D4